MERKTIMGIYIKGLDWPERGMPITITIFNDGAVHEEGVANYQAVEVKAPHGRLIDENDVLRFFNTHDESLAVIEAEVE